MAAETSTEPSPASTSAAPAAEAAPRGEPAVAAILTWFVPGLGHLYLGRLAFGLAAFALVSGAYGLGLWLADGRSFELLAAELRGPLAVALTPEAGNLSGVVYQMQRFGFGLDEPLPWSRTLWLGSLLAALAGLANLALMVDAHVAARFGPAARRRVASPALLVAAGWALPGLGHVLQGRVRRGVVVGALLIGLLVLGTVLSDGSNLSRERHFYFWGAQLLAGLPTIALERLFGDVVVDAAIPRLDVGLLFVAMAGLLNLLALIDVYGWQESRLRGVDPVEDREQLRRAKERKR